MKPISSDLLQAMQSYQGPITKLPDGRASGAGDLETWATRRAEGRAGVPDDDSMTKRREEIAEGRQKRWERFQRSGMAIKMSFVAWQRADWKKRKRFIRTKKRR